MVFAPETVLLISASERTAVVVVVVVVVVAVVVVVVAYVLTHPQGARLKTSSWFCKARICKAARREAASVPRAEDL